MIKLFTEKQRSSYKIKKKITSSLRVYQFSVCPVAGTDPWSYTLWKSLSHVPISGRTSSFIRR